jgi:peptidoglycan/LPS O-acetylase OafA/YrhL
VTAATLFAIGELIDGVVYWIPPGIVFAVVLGLCTWWASRSRGWAPSAVLGLLALGEFLLVVFVYGRGDDPAAWWRLLLYGGLSLVVTVLSAVDIAQTGLRRGVRPKQRA